MKKGDKVKFIGEGDYHGAIAMIESVQVNAMGKEVYIVRTLGPAWALSNFGAVQEKRLWWESELCEDVNESG